MSITKRSPKWVPAPERGLLIAEAARWSGITVDTLRYYERAGLMPSAPARTGGGTRRFHDEDLDWIRVITKLRATGMSIELIRRYAELVRAGEGNEDERLALLETHRSAVLARLETLTENLRLIDRKIDKYRARAADDTTTPQSVMSP